MPKSWDVRWDSVYAEQGFRGKYPEEAVVRFVAGAYFKLKASERKKIRVLDLGAGPGRHVIFLAQEGLRTYGIEASPSAVALCKQKLKELKLKADVRTGDFIRLPYPDNYFDAVIDCASIQHNRIESVKKILKEVRRTLKSGGELFSMVRTSHDYAYAKARKVAPGTFTDYKKYDLNGVGLIHFFSPLEIRQLFKIFREYSYEYTERTFDNRKKRVTHWAIRAKK
jgi:ubiquinone/menaquinone biosynthesis C-methylase UbiE